MMKEFEKEFELLRHWLFEYRLEPRDVTEIMNKVKQIAREYADDVANEAVKGAKMSSVPTPAKTTQSVSPDPAKMTKSLIDGVMDGVTPQIHEFVLSEVHDAIDVELVNMRDLIRGVVARELDAKLEKAVGAEISKRIADLPPEVKKWSAGGRAA